MSPSQCCVVQASVVQEQVPEGGQPPGRTHGCCWGVSVLTWYSMCPADRTCRNSSSIMWEVTGVLQAVRQASRSVTTAACRASVLMSKCAATADSSRGCEAAVPAGLLVPAAAPAASPGAPGEATELLLGADAAMRAAAIHAGCRAPPGEPPAAAAGGVRRPADAAWSSRNSVAYGSPAAEGCSLLQAACTCAHAPALMPT